jgi:hypothetical protein
LAGIILSFAREGQTEGTNTKEEANKQLPSTTHNTTHIKPHQTNQIKHNSYLPVGTSQHQTSDIYSSIPKSFDSYYRHTETKDTEEIHTSRIQDITSSLYSTQPKTKANHTTP